MIDRNDELFTATALFLYLTQCLRHGLLPSSASSARLRGDPGRGGLLGDVDENVDDVYTGLEEGVDSDML